MERRDQTASFPRNPRSFRVHLLVETFTTLVSRWARPRMRCVWTATRRSTRKKRGERGKDAEEILERACLRGGGATSVPQPNGQTQRLLFLLLGEFPHPESCLTGTSFRTFHVPGMRATDNLTGTKHREDRVGGNADLGAARINEFPKRHRCASRVVLGRDQPILAERSAASLETVRVRRASACGDQRATYPRIERDREQRRSRRVA